MLCPARQIPTLARVALMATLAAVPAGAQSTAPARSNPVEADGFLAALVDTLAARMIALEGQRLENQLAGKAATHADVLATDRQFRAFETLLGEQPAPAPIRAEIERRVLRAVEARLAGTLVERRALEAAGELAPTHPRMQRLAEAAKLLEVRRAELRGRLSSAGATPR